MYVFIWGRGTINVTLYIVMNDPYYYDISFFDYGLHPVSYTHLDVYKRQVAQPFPVLLNIVQWF